MSGKSINLRSAYASPNPPPYAAWALLFAAIAVDHDPALPRLHFLPSAETIERFRRALTHPVAVLVPGDRLAKSLFPLLFACSEMAAIRCDRPVFCQERFLLDQLSSDWFASDCLGK